MVGRRRFRPRRGGRSRRKIFWSEANLGFNIAALPNTSCVTGWAAFPAGQYDFTFTPPAFQPEDLTLVRTLAWWDFTSATVVPATARSYNVSFGILAWDAQDGNAYTNALIAHTGIGSVPDPASNTNADWLLKWSASDTLLHLTGQQGFTFSLGTPILESRAQRKLSHDTGVMLIIGWNYDDPAQQDNGDTIDCIANLRVRQAFKLP